MPKKGHRQVQFIAGDTSGPQSLGVLLRDFLESLTVQNYSRETIGKRRLALNHFITWVQERGHTRVLEITRTVLERYQRQIAQAPSDDDDILAMSVRSQHDKLSALRAWFRWLAKQKKILHNPASELELPKLGQHLPKNILSPREVEDILNLADVENLYGLRDRSILELFYSTGIRRMELVRLQLEDIDAERGVLAVRQGKGLKDRFVPMGERALTWLLKYRHDVRPQLAVSDEERTLYLTRFGEPFSGTGMSVLVRDYILRAELDKSGSCHLFRHAMATGMLEGGADIRFIQAMLGHSNMSTTEIYTRVSIEKLKEVHRRTHPVETLSADASIDSRSSE